MNDITNLITSMMFQIFSAKFLVIDNQTSNKWHYFLYILQI